MAQSLTQPADESTAQLHSLTLRGYYLIGRDGRLINQNAPRPSDGAKTVAAIGAALNE